MAGLTKILFVHPVLSQDGATSLAIGDARLLCEQGFEIGFASESGPMEFELDALSVPVHRLWFASPARSSRVVRYCLGVPLNLVVLLWLVLRHRYGCLYMNHRQSVIPGLIVSKLTGVPCVFNAISEFGVRNKGARFTPLGHRVLAVSEQVRQNVTAHFHVSPADVTTISAAVKTDIAPVDEDALTRFNQAWSIPVGSRVVACVAMLVEIKAHDVLLQAWQNVLVSCPDAVLILTGAGPLRTRLEAQCRELGTTANVRFTGLVDDVSVVYRRANLVVLASWSEGLSLSVLEGFARGVPVVCTAVSGMPEVVLPEQTGLLVEPGNTEQLSGAIVRLLSDPVLGATFGRAGRRLVEAKYSANARGAALGQYFRQF